MDIASVDRVDPSEFVAPDAGVRREEATPSRPPDSGDETFDVRFRVSRPRWPNHVTIPRKRWQAVSCIESLSGEQPLRVRHKVERNIALQAGRHSRISSTPYEQANRRPSCAPSVQLQAPNAT